MTALIYKSSANINRLQQEIMIFIDWWVHIKKTCVPRSDIITKMVTEGHKDFTVISAITVLLRKGYIRRTSRATRKTSFVQLRSI